MGVILPNNTTQWSGQGSNLGPPLSNLTFVIGPKKIISWFDMFTFTVEMIEIRYTKISENQHSGLVFELNVLQIAVVGKVTGS